MKTFIDFQIEVLLKNIYGHLLNYKFIAILNISLSIKFVKRKKEIGKALLTPRDN